MAMDEDLTVFLDDDDFAVGATFGAETANVLLDKPTGEVLGGEMLSTEYAIIYRAEDLTAVIKGSTGTVDGVSYRVREVTLVDDGALKRATLSKA